MVPPETARAEVLTPFVGQISPRDNFPGAPSTNFDSEPPNWFVYLMTFFLYKYPKLRVPRVFPFHFCHWEGEKGCRGALNMFVSLTFLDG